MFPELLDEGLQPWSVTWFLVGGHTRPNYAVDVTGAALEAGIASLEAHGRVPRRYPRAPDAPGAADHGHRGQGRAAGVDAAVLFRGWNFAAPPSMPGEQPAS